MVIHVNTPRGVKAVNSADLSTGQFSHGMSACWTISTDRLQFCAARFRAVMWLLGDFSYTSYSIVCICGLLLSVFGDPDLAAACNCAMLLSLREPCCCVVAECDCVG